MALSHPYYSYNKVLSYNATYNFIVGGRGLGKTYGAKKKAIEDWIRRGEQFIYLRRYKSELATARNTFMNDIKHLFPKYTSRINGFEMQMALIDSNLKDANSWDTVGYFIVLSTSQSMKSVAFPRVTKIIFDEFIIEKGAIRYLPDEAVIFNNFYSTVDRWQDKTKVFFLANSVSIMNPYFLKYNIHPDETGADGIIRAMDGFVVCHFPDSKLFASSVMQTKFGKFIFSSDEDYVRYAVGNVFVDNNENMVSAKDPRSHYVYTIETRDGSFSVWLNIFTREYSVQEKLPKEQRILTLIPELMSKDKTLVSYSDKLMSQLRAGFKHGRMTFDKPSTRNTFIQVFKR